jgi:hypothetical protein
LFAEGVWVGLPLFPDRFIAQRLIMVCTFAHYQEKDNAPGVNRKATVGEQASARK